MQPTRFTERQGLQRGEARPFNWCRPTRAREDTDMTVDRNTVRKGPRLGLYAIALVSAASVPVHADSHLELQQVRTSVSTYDLSEGGTLDALGALSAALEERLDDRDVEREARFLRAAVSADLLFVATYRADDTVRERLCALWGSDGSDLRQRIDEALSASDGIYREPAQRMVRRLSLIDNTGRMKWDELGHATGSWRQAATIRKAARALDQGDGSQLLSTLGKDPCEGVARGCTPLFMPFDTASRQRMAGLRSLGAAMAGLRRAEREGDPLARLIKDDVRADFAAIRALSVRPSPRLREGVKVDAELANVEPVPVGLLVHVTEEVVEYGYLPTVRLDDDGELVASSVGAPTLPELASVSLPRHYRPYMRPISDVVDAFRSNEGSDMVVGVTTDHDVPAHVVGRVLISLRRAGLDRAAMVARGAEGVALGVPLRVVVGSEAESMRPRPDVQVRVRLGGYSLKLGAWSLDIPRVKREAGFRFDTDSLQQRVSRRKIRSAAVSFMGDVAVGNVMAAMWRVAPASDRLNVVMP